MVLNLLSVRLDAIMELAKVQIEAVVLIAYRMIQKDAGELIGFRMIEKKYHTKVYAIITGEDINHAIRNGIIKE